MRSPVRPLYAFAFLAIALVATSLAACGSDPTPTAAPNPTPTPTAISDAGSGNPTPTPATAATATPTRAPTATPTPGKPYYEGKTIRLIVGWGAGSNSDVQARYVASNLPKFIPGNPRFVISAVPSRSAYFAQLNELFDGPGDGLKLAYGVGGVTPEQLTFKDEVTFEADKFKHVFSFDLIPSVLYAHKDTPYSTLEEWIAGSVELTIAAAAEGDSRWTQMVFLKEKLGIPARVLTGFDTSTPGSFLTMDRHDADIVSAGFWYRLGTDRPGWLTDGYVKPFAIMSDYSVTISPNTEGPLPAGIKNVRDFLSPEEVREFNALQAGEGALQRPALMSKNTPDDIRSLISDAMVAAFDDAEFKSGLEKLLGRSLSLVDGPALDTLAESVDVKFLDEVYKKYSPTYESPF